MGQEETRGKEKQLLGQGNEIVGVLTGDTALELKGGRQQAEGAAQDKLGKARRKARESMGGAASAAKK